MILRWRMINKKITFSGTSCLPTEQNRVYKDGNRCLILSSSPTTWFESLDFCTSLNANLAMVNSMKTLEAIARTVKSDGQFWIGLHRITWGKHNINHTGRLLAFIYMY